jgi:hypothetical protein
MWIHETYKSFFTSVYPISRLDTLILYYMCCLVVRVMIGITFLLTASLDTLNYILTAWGGAYVLLTVTVLLWRHHQPWWWSNRWRKIYRTLVGVALLVLGIVGLVVDDDTTVHQVAGCLVIFDAIQGATQYTYRLFFSKK